MEVSKIQWKPKSGWNQDQLNSSIKNASLILCFGGRSIIEETDKFNHFKQDHPNAEIVYCSTAGEIFDIEVLDDSVAVIMMKFKHTPIRTIKKNIKDFSCSSAAGVAILKELNAPDLNHVFILSDGQLINGSELVEGMYKDKNEKTIITGGLAGDGYQFQKTLVGLNNKPEEGNIVAIGYYGDNLKVGFGCKAGWDLMSKSRQVTKSNKNVLYELDGQSALSLYKTYLGAAASELPGAALYYPLSIVDVEGKEKPVIRTILSINEKDQSMTFAGNIPEGYNANLMKRNPERLISGAGTATVSALDSVADYEPDLALIVSCVGRKIVLGQNVDEEVEEVQNILGDKVPLSGFYAYGEIGPNNNQSDCELHNQTIAVTTYKEI